MNQNQEKIIVEVLKTPYKIDIEKVEQVDHIKIQSDLVQQIQEENKCDQNEALRIFSLKWEQTSISDLNNISEEVI